MLNVPASLRSGPEIISPAEIYQQGLQLRSLGQQNETNAFNLAHAKEMAPFQVQQAQQQVQGFQPNIDAIRLKNEEMANELAEQYISSKARELKALPIEKRAAAAQGITNWLTARQKMYPEYAHVYDPSPLDGATWDDNYLSKLESLSLKPEDRYKIDHPAAPEQPAEVKEYQYYVQQETGAGRQPKGFEEWRLQGKKAGASNTAITVKTGEELGKQVAKNFANEVSTLNTDAEAAAATIPSIRNSIKLVDQGIIAGTGADIRLALSKALATATGTPDAPTNNTDEFIGNTAKLVAENIKNFGSGTGLSDADREYAQKMAGGSIQMTPQAIKRILQVNEKVQRAKIDRYNKRRNTLVKNNPELASYYDEIKVEEPPQQPTATTTVAPKSGTIENGYRFKGGNPADKNNWEKIR